MRNQKSNQRKRRDDVCQIPGIANSVLEQRLKRQNKPGDSSHDGNHHGQIAGKLNVVHGHRPVDKPVPDLIPGIRDNENQSYHRMQEHHDLVGNIKW